MASADLEALVGAISTAQSLKLYEPEDRDAEAAKIVRLRQLRLAKEAMDCEESAMAKKPINEKLKPDSVDKLRRALRTPPPVRATRQEPKTRKSGHK